MRIAIREEGTADAPIIAGVVKRAYEAVPYSNHREHLMIERLRATPAYIPGLSLIAEVAGEAVGHILLTEVTIRGEHSTTRSLALAPLSVVPEYQGRGIGGRLVREAHRRAGRLGFGSIVLVGTRGYYNRFGYEPLRSYPIKIPLDVPDDHCMIVSLTAAGLSGVSGTVDYPPEWMEREAIPADQASK